MEPIKELNPLVIRSTHPSSSSNAISPQITSPSNITSPHNNANHISNPGTPQNTINRSDSGTFARRPHLGSSGSITRMSDRMQEVVKVENCSNRLNPQNINFHHHNHHQQQPQQHQHQLQQNNHPNNSGGLPIFRNTPQFNPLQQNNNPNSSVASSAPTFSNPHIFQQNNNNFQFSQTIQPQRVVNSSNLVMGNTDVFHK